MTQQDLLSLKDVIGGVRFAYAAALVGAKCQETKQAHAYMSELARLNKVLDAAIAKATGEKHE